jgi:transcriptional regulator with PAS, ATPase and Fis domain
VGGRRSIPVDFRVVAATNRDLRAMTHEGTFREDLFWRINVVTIEIPPLCDRPEDVLPLAEHFLDELRRSMNRRDLTLGTETRELLQTYPWPGNVRELQNAIERAVVLGSSHTVEAVDLPLYVREPQASPSSKALADVERAHVLNVLEGADWNVTHAARALGIDRGTLYHKMRKFELARPGTPHER